jgi:hypothetical protein
LFASAAAASAAALAASSSAAAFAFSNIRSSFGVSFFSSFTKESAMIKFIWRWFRQVSRNYIEDVEEGLQLFDGWGVNLGEGAKFS